MKTKIKLLKGLLIGALLLATNFLVAQTNTSPVQTVCAGSIAEPYLINPPTAGSTYQWSLSGGGTLNNGLATDNITVDWGMNPGTYTITVIETDVNGCDGAPVTVDVTVLALPSPTVASSQTACLGGIIPDLSAVGLAPNWYTDIALTNNVFSGNSFPTGETAVGLYTYYVTETLNGCEGDAVPVTLEIYSLPTSPVAANEVVCEGSAIPDLTATGTSVVWYSDAALTTVVAALVATVEFVESKDDWSALVPIEVVIVEAKFASSPIAAASSLRVSSAAGEESTKLATELST